MKLRFRCPRCEAPQQREVTDDAREIRCENCDWRRSLEGDANNPHQPRNCLVCGNADLWRQKDFPQAAGLAFVAAGAVLSSIAWYFHRPVWALGILLAFAAADLILFAVMPDVLVCYRCRARHSRSDAGEYPTFDHETAERYRQAELRLKRAATDEVLS